MTREETKQFLPIFKAYSEGKTIQFRDSANNWHDFEQETVLIFDGDVNDYRVKPSEVENEVKINKDNEFVALFFKFLTKDNDADLNESIKKFMTDEEINK